MSIVIQFKISNSYSKGTVNGDYVGGLIGDIQDGSIGKIVIRMEKLMEKDLLVVNWSVKLFKIYNSYNVTVNGDNRAGGLIGRITNDSIVENCYSDGS